MPLNLPSIGPNKNFAGIGEFTRALMGGDATREKSYRNEIGALTSVEKKIAEAAMAARQNRSQAGIEDGAVVGRILQSPEMGADVAQILGAGGGNANVLLGALMKAHALQSKQNAQALAMEPDSGYSPINAQLVGLANKPLETANIEGGNIILNPYAADPAIFPTEQGKAQISAAEALTGQRNASAGASMARAALSNRTDPNRSRSGGKKPVASPAGPKVGDVEDGYRFKGGNPSDPAAWEKL